MLIIITIALIINKTIFYGAPDSWCIILSSAMILAPLSIVMHFKIGASLSFFIGLFVVVSGFSLLDGSSMMEISVIENVQQPSNFDIYFTIIFIFLYVIVSGIATVLASKKNNNTATS
jgi:hypothetical protein